MCHHIKAGLDPRKALSGSSSHLNFTTPPAILPARDFTNTDSSHSYKSGIMAPPSADVDVAQSPASPTSVPVKTTARTIPEIKKSIAGITQSASFPEPLTYSGSLDNYDSSDVTSVIGREFPKLQLSEILNDDAKIRDLAILVSQRGVVFFRNQDIDIEGQKALGQRLGELTGKPETSKLHKHALANSKRGIAVDENGKLDDEVSVISSEVCLKFYLTDLY